FEIIALQLGQRHRRVDVVESGHAARDALDKMADVDSLEHVGSNDYRIGSADLLAPILKLFQRSVEFEPAVTEVGDVAVLAVPEHVALEEQDIVAVPGEPLEQRPERRRMAVAPRRGQAEAEHHQLHAATSSRRLAIWERSSVST